ncbi:anhydro-N-acetylmuramic acid kinase [uncultured Algibacter sp.]|uniref:anhydro-N-acetylmuramic acid kinase n=1 Tax=uncultured Algibacter sp. TaxID=298659 RepID=UPI00344AF165
MKEYNVIGVMSGTSLDGLDLIYVSFKFDKKWQFKINSYKTVEYNKKWKVTLTTLVDLTSEELEEVDNDYTKYLAKEIRQFIEETKIDKLDVVSSHGHTALHKPDEGITYQIGNKAILSKLLGEVVVCDFRVQDVLLGGQGAPLVPIGDKLLFSAYEFCLNLGGFANISFDKSSHRIAYDICPVNIVLNHYIKTLGFDYDDEGQMASTGKINTNLLKKLNELTFYEEAHPKSLGLEWVSLNIFPLIDSYKLEVIDILRTFIEHIAIQIASAINDNKKGSVLVTGGGVYNKFLMKRIKTLSEIKTIVPSRKIIEFKEALIFAFLGVLKLRNEVNCLKSVTGAVNDHSSGNIFYP